MTDEMRHGSCLCGAITYTVVGPMRDVFGCHCSQCRKHSGHYYAATQAPREAVSIESEETLRWYRSSERAERGFCSTCGSSLFWRMDGDDSLSILAGSLDAPTGLRLTRHIFCADKGDYYEIADDVPQLAKW